MSENYEKLKRNCAWLQAAHQSAQACGQLLRFDLAMDLAMLSLAAGGNNCPFTKTSFPNKQGFEPLRDLHKLLSEDDEPAAGFRLERIEGLHENDSHFEISYTDGYDSDHSYDLYRFKQQLSYFIDKLQLDGSKLQSSCNHWLLLGMSQGEDDLYGYAVKSYRQLVEHAEDEEVENCALTSLLVTGSLFADLQQECNPELAAGIRRQVERARRKLFGPPPVTASPVPSFGL